MPIWIGYFVGIIGFLGLAFIVGESYNPPLHTEKFDAGLICRITPWGAVFSDEGYTVHLYQHWNAVPFLERDVERIVIDESEPQAGLSSASCHDVFVKYSNSHRS